MQPDGDLKLVALPGERDEASRVCFYGMEWISNVVKRKDVGRELLVDDRGRTYSSRYTFPWENGQRLVRDCAKMLIVGAILGTPRRPPRMREVQKRIEELRPPICQGKQPEITLPNVIL